VIFKKKLQKVLSKLRSQHSRNCCTLHDRDSWCLTKVFDPNQNCVACVRACVHAALQHLTLNSKLLPAEYLLPWCWIGSMYRGSRPNFSILLRTVITYEEPVRRLGFWCRSASAKAKAKGKSASEGIDDVKVHGKCTMRVLGSNRPADLI